jgi:hypothetical protein
VYIALHYNIYSSNAIEHDLFVFVLTPVSHFGHICTSGVELLVTCQNCQLQ